MESSIKAECHDADGKAPPHDILNQHALDRSCNGADCISGTRVTAPLERIHIWKAYMRADGLQPADLHV